jgi:Cupin domain
MTGFRPCFNPATRRADRIHRRWQQRLGPRPVQLAQRPWRVITEHSHPSHDERFIITDGEAHFTLGGEEATAQAGATTVVAAGVPHAKETWDLPRARPSSNSGPGRALGSSTRPSRADSTERPRPGERRATRSSTALTCRHFRSESRITRAAHRSAEHQIPAALGGSEGIRRAPTQHPAGQPDPRARSAPASEHGHGRSEPTRTWLRPSEEPLAAGSDPAQRRGLLRQMIRRTLT